MIRYIQGRPGKDGERVTRPLFSVEGEVAREEACRLIDEAGKQMRFFHLILNPDPKREDSFRDLLLREIAHHTMQTLEKRLNQVVTWIAAEHNDHTDKRHVHLVAALKGRLSVQDLTLLRESATQAALLQRQRLDLAQTQDYRRYWRIRSSSLRPPITGRQTTRRFPGRSSSRRTPRNGPAPAPVPFGIMTCSCPHCFASQPKHLTRRVQRCQSCGRKLNQEPKLRLMRKERERKEDSGWEL